MALCSIIVPKVPLDPKQSVYVFTLLLRFWKCSVKSQFLYEQKHWNAWRQSLKLIRLS